MTEFCSHKNCSRDFFTRINGIEECYNHSLLTLHWELCHIYAKAAYIISKRENIELEWYDFDPEEFEHNFEKYEIYFSCCLEFKFFSQRDFKNFCESENRDERIKIIEKVRKKINGNNSIAIRINYDENKDYNPFVS